MRSDVEWWEIWRDYNVVLAGDNRKALARLISDVRQETRAHARDAVRDMSVASDVDREGWGVIRPGDRRAHFYRKGQSLCLRVGFYNGPLEPDKFISVNDCAACRRKLGPPSGEDRD